ncbi:MAG TPA: hypothetical protein PLQ36_04020, partial [Candidatus Gracilibacteria bacterium]|nr:hypothetical protein [Candidatus Gracilibacteria bacterium]
NPNDVIAYEAMKIAINCLSEKNLDILIQEFKSIPRSHIAVISDLIQEKVQNSPKYLVTDIQKNFLQNLK